MRFWAKNPPHAFVEEPLSREKITVWCAIGYGCLIGPYVFEDADGTPVTVDKELYLAILKRFYWPKIRRSLDRRE